MSKNIEVIDQPRFEVQKSYYENVLRLLVQCYGNFGYLYPEAPILEISSPREGLVRGDAGGLKVPFHEKVGSEAAFLENLLNQPTVFSDGTILGMTTEAVSPHTIKTVEVNGIKMATQLVYWLLDTNEKLIKWITPYSKEEKEKIIQLLASVYFNSLKLFAQMLGMPLEDLLKDERLKSYALTGFSDYLVRLADCTSRGSQSSKYFHGHFSLQNALLNVQQKIIKIVSSHEMLKLLNPLNALFMQECGQAFANLLKQQFANLGEKNVTVTPVIYHKSDREKKELAVNDHVVLTFAEPVPVAKLFDLLFSLYNRIEDINQQFFVLKKYLLAYADKEFFNRDPNAWNLELYCERANLDYKDMLVIWNFVKRLRPTRQMLIEAVEVARDIHHFETVKFLERDLKQMESVAKHLIPEGLTKDTPPEEVKQKLEARLTEFLNSKGAKFYLKNIPPALQPAFLRMIQDIVKPRELVTTVSGGVASAFFSSAMHFTKHSINEQGELCISEMTITPTIGGETGGAELQTQGGFTRAEAAVVH